MPALPAIGCTLNLADAYRRVTFAGAPHPEVKCTRVFTFF